MKDLAWRVSLAVVVLLASLGTASAECAWVLWAKEGFYDGTTEPWSLIHVGAARDDCLDAMRRSAHRYKENMGRDAQMGRDSRDPWALFVFHQDHSVTLRCLPDSVDPRAGAKAKQ